ncbi:hypothetical protein H4219_000224 [Mycoemilia scoparia]|uniref:Uncharacterized protein n=1 Tax=Mycoemilia scoparia TaxID=417184 RepID=A0A9W8DRM6_9FUNG|nr:hypothetical protein H4219_000224 [Mycoemilia scoparia]
MMQSAICAVVTSKQSWHSHPMAFSAIKAETNLFIQLKEWLCCARSFIPSQITANVFPVTAATIPSEGDVELVKKPTPLRRVVSGAALDNLLAGSTGQPKTPTTEDPQFHYFAQHEQSRGKVHIVLLYTHAPKAPGQYPDDKKRGLLTTEHDENRHRDYKAVHD